MSLVSRIFPFALVAAALVAACSDATAPAGAPSSSGSAVASKGSGSGGGGSSSGSGSGGGSTTQLVVTTPPTVNATGRWLGTSDGPDVPHTYTFTLTQTDAGQVSGSGTMATLTQNASYLVVGTVNADTLMLYTGTTCSGCTVSPLYRGIVSADGSRVEGNFLNGGISPVTLVRQ